MADDIEKDVRATYRYLRGTIVALLLMLVVSVVLQSADSGCVLGSISSYYFTPVRAVFVGSLFALGAALIAYQGNTSEEDVLLNFSGLMAFVVALVPTVPDTHCESGGPDVAAAGFAMSDQEIANAVTNNIRSLIVVTVLAVVVVMIMRKRANSKAGILEVVFGRFADAASRRWTITITVVCGAVVAIELALFLALRDRFISISHGVAASTMVLGVIAVMLLNLRRVHQRYPAGTEMAYKRWYWILVVLLGLALGGATAAAWTFDQLDHLILIAELIVIGDFIAYWTVQTAEFNDSKKNVALAA